MRCRLAVLMTTMAFSDSLWVAASPSSGSGSSGGSSNAYESVRLLNRYGQADELLAASAAADQRGQCIVAIRNCRDGSIWIVSPRVDRPRHHRHDAQQRRRSDDARLLHAVTAPTPATVWTSGSLESPAVYLVCAGVRADATWLLLQLRQYCKTIAERYGSGNSAMNRYDPDDETAPRSHATTPTSIAWVTAALKRRFWGYPEHGDRSTQTPSIPWTSPGYETLLDSYRDENGNALSWGRPMGLRSMVLSVQLHDVARSGMDALTVAHLDLVEPSGVVSGLGYHNETDVIPMLGMGQGSRAILDALRQQYHEFNATEPHMNDTALEAWILNAMNAAAAVEPSHAVRLEIYTRQGTVTQRTLTVATVSNS